jgi:hypothetical protein
MEGKRLYVRPELKVLGSVADLTRTGGTNPGVDGKGGSVPQSKGI